VNDLIGDVVTSAGSFISDALFNKPPSRLGTVGDVMNRGLESVNEYIIEEFIPTFGLETWEDIAGFAARQVGQFGGTFSGNLSTQLTKTEDLLDEAGNIVREGIGLGRDDDDERPLTVRTKSGPAPITGIEGPQPLAVVEPIPFEVFSGGSFPAGGSGRQDCVPESEFRSSFERLDDESDDDYLLRLESEVRRLKKEGKIC
jgi:hypothetical protein